MALHRESIPAEVLTRLRQGVVIPAHPLALTETRQLDLRHQRALTRYYLDAGAGGLAVGVHTTQFEIRHVGLYEPVLRLAAETAASWTDQPIIMIAGLVGSTEQALAEAQRIGRIGHWRIDGGRGIMSMSKEAYRALGYDAGDDERTLEVIRAAVHPDDLEKLEEARN